MRRRGKERGKRNCGLKETTEMGVGGRVGKQFGNTNHTEVGIVERAGQKKERVTTPG